MYLFSHFHASADPHIWKCLKDWHHHVFSALQLIMKMKGFAHFSSYCCLGTNFREWLNIQNRDPLPSGPSFMNSWPRGLPHFPQRTFRAETSTPGGTSTRPLLVSIFLARESEWTGLENAGQGVWCWYFSVLKKKYDCPFIILIYQTFTSRKEDNHTYCTRTFPHWNCLYGSPVLPKSKKTFWIVLSEIYLITQLDQEKYI